MKKHFNITVSGKVHDVFFRDSARKLAHELGLFGSASNRPDKTVYIEIEGDEDALLKFIAWCHRGPEHARVEKVEATEGPLQNFTNFSIR